MRLDCAAAAVRRRKKRRRPAGPPIDSPSPRTGCQTHIHCLALLVIKQHPVSSSVGWGQGVRGDRGRTNVVPFLKLVEANIPRGHRARAFAYKVRCVTRMENKNS